MTTDAPAPAVPPPIPAPEMEFPRRRQPTPIPQGKSSFDQIRDDAASIQEFARLPVVHTTFSIAAMIMRTNHYLATSPPEMHLVRMDRCATLEQILIDTGNMLGYDYLEPNPPDLTRRRYKISPKLIVQSRG